MKALSRPLTAVILGLILSIVGLFLIQLWGGLNDIQGASSPAEFAKAAHAQGNQLRSASWADILVFVPGYVLLLSGVLALFRRSADTPRRVRQASLVGTAFVLVGASADQLENLMVRLGIGGVDLGISDTARFVDPSGVLIDILQVAMTIKFAFLGLAIATILALAAGALLRQIRHGRR